MGATRASKKLKARLEMGKKRRGNRLSAEDFAEKKLRQIKAIQANNSHQPEQEQQRQKEAEKKRLLSESPYVPPWRLPEEQATEEYKRGDGFVKQMFAKHRPEIVKKVRQETKPLIATG